MTKEEQKAGARRIMAKMGPMNAEEQRTYEQLVKRPEEYIPPNKGTGERVCGICSETFPSLAEFSDHMAEHNPSPGQWVGAHRKIQDGRERSKREQGR